MEHFRGFSTYIGQEAFELRIRHAVALAEIPQRSAEFAVRAAILANYKFCQRRIGARYLNGILKLFLINKHTQPSVFAQ